MHIYHNSISPVVHSKQCAYDIRIDNRFFVSYFRSNQTREKKKTIIGKRKSGDNNDDEKKIGLFFVRSFENNVNERRNTDKSKLRHFLFRSRHSLSSSS